MTELIPCLLERKIVPKVWGGRALADALGIALPAGEAVGESWEVYDRPGGSSRLRGSETTLHELLVRDPRALLGEARATPHGLFPIAVKFLDAAQALSVQVHPDHEQALADGDCAKPETWVVLRAGEHGLIRRGFRAGVTRADFAAAAGTEKVLALLESFRPAAGDVVSLPAGTVHSLGPDVVVCEVQCNGDLTYRVFDWGRRPELHLEQATRAARFDRPPQTTVAPQPAGDGGEWLVREPGLRLRRYRLERPLPFRTDGAFALITLLSGRATVGWKSRGEHAPLMLERADTVLVPASVDEVFVSPIGTTTLLVSDAGAS